MSVSTGTLGVAVVGLGVGEQHARAFAAHPSCSLLAVCDLDRDRAARGAATYRCRVATFQEILDDGLIQVVSIASYDDAHAEQVREALVAGKHVFVEKPLCRTTGELQTIRAAIRPGQVIASNLILRAAPMYRWLRRQIEAGVLGDLYAIDGDYLFGRLNKITDGWRKDVPDYSVMQGGGIHLVDLMIWMAGELPVAVSAQGNRVCSSDSAFRYNDFSAATFRFASSLIGRITANFGCVHRHQHVLRVFGTRATFIYDDCGARLHSSRSPDTAPQLIDVDPLPAAKGDRIPEFVDRILLRQGHGGVDLDVMTACMAADTALRANREIEICYL